MPIHRKARVLFQSFKSRSTTTINYKSTSIPFALVLCVVSVAGAVAPRGVFASIMYEFEFVGSAGGVVTGQFEIMNPSMMQIVDENNVVSIGVSSTTGIGGSTPFNIDPSDGVPDRFSFDTVSPTIMDIAISDRSTPQGQNDYACGNFNSTTTTCDMIFASPQDVFNEPNAQQTVNLVPEPTTLLLMGLGLVGLGFARQRRPNA